MADTPATMSPLNEVQQTLRDILPYTKSTAELVAISEEIRKYENELGKKKTGLVVATSILAQGSTLTLIEDELLTAFRAAAQAGKDLAGLLGLAKEIRKYEHDINKQNKSTTPAP